MANFDAGAEKIVYDYTKYDTNGDNRIDANDNIDAKLRKALDIPNKTYSIETDFDKKTFDFALEYALEVVKAKKEQAHFTEGVNKEFGLNNIEVKSDYKSFIEDANGKQLDFNKEIKKESAAFKLKCMQSIMEDLEKGYEGGIVVGGNLKITYDRKKSSFVMIINNAEKKTLSKEVLQKVLTEIASKDVPVTGYSRKVSIE